VYVVEALGRHVTLILHDGAIGPLQIGKPGSTAWLDPVLLGFRDLLPGESKYSTRSGPSIATDQYDTSVVRRVEREEVYFLLEVEREILPYVDHLPTKVPYRSLWFTGRGWIIDLIEKDIYFSCL
jgi:hypothetical protein